MMLFILPLKWKENSKLYGLKFGEEEIMTYSSEDSTKSIQRIYRFSL